jgi:hypothetical protein
MVGGYSPWWDWITRRDFKVNSVQSSVISRNFLALITGN